MSITIIQQHKTDVKNIEAGVFSLVGEDRATLESDLSSVLGLRGRRCRQASSFSLPFPETKALNSGGSGAEPLTLHSSLMQDNGYTPVFMYS